MKLIIRITLSLVVIATLSSSGCKSKEKCAAYQGVQTDTVQK